MDEEPRRLEEVEQRIAIAQYGTGDEPAACEAEHVAMSRVAARDPKAVFTGHLPDHRKEVEHHPEDPRPAMVDAQWTAHE